MDYRALLQKYIDHVGDREGVDFLAAHHRQPGHFTDEEWQELQVLGGWAPAPDDRLPDPAGAATIFRVIAETNADAPEYERRFMESVVVALLRGLGYGEAMDFYEMTFDAS
jgi:hypothetical protein